VIAVDFDHTIYQFTHKWEHIEEAIELVKRAHKLGLHLMCFTANENHTLVRHVWARDLGIQNIEINNSPIDVFESTKPFYSLLIDDRAGDIEYTLEQFEEVLNYIEFYSKNPLPNTQK
jgi:hypothetical protein